MLTYLSRGISSIPYNVLSEYVWSNHDDTRLMLLHNILTKIQRLLLKSTSSTIFFNFQCCISVTLTATAVVNHYVSKYPLMSHLNPIFILCASSVCVVCGNVSKGQMQICLWHTCHWYKSCFAYCTHCVCTCYCRFNAGDKAILLWCMDWRRMPGNLLSQQNTTAKQHMWRCVENIIGWGRRAFVQTAGSSKGQCLMVNKYVHWQQQTVEVCRRWVFLCFLQKRTLV